MFARRRISSSSSTLRLWASSITSAVISPARVTFAKEPLETLEQERLGLARLGAQIELEREQPDEVVRAKRQDCSGRCIGRGGTSRIRGPPG